MISLLILVCYVVQAGVMFILSYPTKDLFQTSAYIVTFTFNKYSLELLSFSTVSLLYDIFRNVWYASYVTNIAEIHKTLKTSRHPLPSFWASPSVFNAFIGALVSYLHLFGLPVTPAVGDFTVRISSSKQISVRLIHFIYVAFWPSVLFHPPFISV